MEDMSENSTDPTEFENYKIVGVSSLFSCLAIVSTGEEKEDLFGIPGFYDAMNKRFIRLDGKPVSEDFRVKISDFITEKTTVKEEAKDGS